MDNETKLFVAKSEMIRVMQGNTRGRQGEQTIDITDDHLLLKRNKKGETKSIIKNVIYSHNFIRGYFDLPVKYRLNI